MSTKTVTVQVECDACKATGIYRGCAEPQGVGVICQKCDGSGSTTITYTPFDRRKLRNDISTVQYSRGSLIALGVGPHGKAVTYDEFLMGKLPPKS